MSARGLRSILVLVLIAVAQPALAEESAPMTRAKREQAARINAELAITYMKQGNLQAARDKIDRALKQHGIPTMPSPNGKFGDDRCTVTGDPG